MENGRHRAGGKQTDAGVSSQRQRQSPALRSTSGVNIPGRISVTISPAKEMRYPTAGGDTKKARCIE